MKKLYIELADTPSKRELGLMHRRHLGYNEGMLFRFPCQNYLSFWMKDTHIPLDIAFIKDNGEITQINQMMPLSQKRVSSHHPCKFALEVNRGWFDSNNVKVGSKLKGLHFGNIVTARTAQVNTPPDPNATQDPNQQNQVKPEIMLNFGIRDKLKYSEERGLKMKIIYVSKNGHYVGPRIISPVPQEGNKYPILQGELGDYFKAFDESPTITGPNYVVEGGRIKSYFFNGVESLEILDANGQPLKFMKGQPVDKEHEPEKEQEVEEKIPKEEEIKNYFKRSIPKFTDDQWNMIRPEVMKNLHNGFSMENLVNNVKEYILSWLFKWKNRKK